MKFFIDTASIEEIKEAHSWGIIDGVTTNPTLIAKEGKDFKETIKEISSIVRGPISAEVVSLDCDGMVREAEEINSWSDNIVIKIPMNSEGIKATKLLAARGIDTNVTLIFSLNQALIAAKAGATYVSPFVGRLDDIGDDGMKLIEDIVEVFSWYDFETEVIVASIRHPMHVYQAMKIGAHISTIPFKVLKQMFKHPLTDIGLERFLSDWRGFQQKSSQK